MFTINVFTEYEKKFAYIKELNNNIILDNSYADGTYILDKNELLNIIRTNANEEYEKIKRLINEYTNLINNESYINSNRYFVYVLTMHPSRKCNLKCKYCFAEAANNYLPENEINLNTAIKAIDFLVDNFGRYGFKYQIDISGSGEPLLKYDFIMNLNEYCENKSNETGKEIKIMFPTNAILLTDEMADFFNKSSNVLIGVSIDGNIAHTANRVLKNGENAYNHISNGAKKLKRPFGIAVTVTHINEAVDEVYDYLYNEFEYADCISMELVRNYDKSSEISFYHIDMENLIKHYKKLADNLYSHIISNDYEYVFKILRGQDTFGNYLLMILHKGKITLRRCGAGLNMISVDDKGNLYSCSVANGDSNFQIGNLTEGIDNEKNKKFATSTVFMNERCNNCWASFICGGECHVKAFMANGDINSPNDTMCQIRYELIQLAIALVEKIRMNDFTAYKTLKAFRIDNTKADSSLWVASKYLMVHIKTIKYSEIEKQAVRGKYGMNPDEMFKLLKQYVPKIIIIDLVMEVQLKMISYPAVVFLDKYKYGYQYAIIECYENGKLKMHSIHSPEPIYFSFKQFIEEISNTIMSIMQY